MSPGTARALPPFWLMESATWLALAEDGKFVVSGLFLTDHEDSVSVFDLSLLYQIHSMRWKTIKSY